MFDNYFELKDIRKIPDTLNPIQVNDECKEEMKKIFLIASKIGTNISTYDKEQIYQFYVKAKDTYEYDEEDLREDQWYTLYISSYQCSPCDREDYFLSFQSYNDHGNRMICTDAHRDTYDADFLDLLKAIYGYITLIACNRKEYNEWIENYPYKYRCGTISRKDAHKFGFNNFDFPENFLNLVENHSTDNQLDHYPTPIEYATIFNDAYKITHFDEEDRDSYENTFKFFQDHASHGYLLKEDSDLKHWIQENSMYHCTQPVYARIGLSLNDHDDNLNYHLCCHSFSWYQEFINLIIELDKLGYKFIISQFDREILKNIYNEIGEYKVTPLYNHHDQEGEVSFHIQVLTDEVKNIINWKPLIKVKEDET